MKLIFLDIDGPLNVIPQGHDEYGGIFHQHFVDNLAKIIDATGAKIVLSSSWRKSSLKIMQEMWVKRGLPGEIIDVTPTLRLRKGGSIIFWNDKLNQKKTPSISGYSIPRGCEIDYWIRNEAAETIESYVIIDDDTDMLMHQKDKFVQCSGNTNDEDCIDLGFGLTNKCTEKAIEILNGVSLGR